MAEAGLPGPVPCREDPPPNPAPQLLPQPGQQVPMHMNWSHFKPEFSGKPEEDVEAHLLRTNDWMNIHDFPDGVKVQRFCLTLTGEARLWYASLEPIVMTWQELQNQFRRQYSKLGNTREQLFHAWMSFHYDENVEMPDAYVTRIRQVARLLGYGEPQVLEVFRNAVPNRLYWVLFPTDNLRYMVETAKRFLTKERIERQMTRQSSTPFMKLNDTKGKKAVSFDARDVLEGNSENIERMTVLMDKVYIKLDQKDVSYKPQIYQRRGRGQNRQNFKQNNNNWRRNRSFSRERNYSSNRGYGCSRGYFRRGGFRGRNSGNFRGNNNWDRNRKDRRPWTWSRPRERGVRARSESCSRSRSNSRDSTNRDRVRCFKVESMIILLMSVQIWSLKPWIGKVIVQDKHPCRFWQIVTQAWKWNNI